LFNRKAALTATPQMVDQELPTGRLRGICTQVRTPRRKFHSLGYKVKKTAR